MPVVEALLAWERSGLCSFHTPGHRQGREVAAEVAALLPERLFALDATELPGLDDLHHPQGIIARAQRLLADLYGADESFFLVGGSTAGIMAALLAAGGPGKRLLMARYSHRAAFAAAILSGCRVRYLPEEWSGDGLPVGPSPAEAARAVRDWRPAVLLLTRPNYYGIGFPLEQVVEACRQVGTVLVVDEAHGAHWGVGGLPSALDAGADLVVQSAHKTLPALTQGAWLHLVGSRLDGVRLRASLRMVQSSSPSYLLMASLDAARWHLGRWLPEATVHLERARQLQKRLERAGVFLLPRDLPPGWVHDPLRLVVDTAQMGWEGREAANFLREAGIEVEWAEPDRVLILLGLRPGPDSDALAEVLTRLPGRGTRTAVVGGVAGARVGSTGIGPYPRLEAVTDPTRAWWAEQETVPLERAVGRIAGDMLYLSPPGVPVVAPGERWSEEALAFVRRCHEMGLVPVGRQEPGMVRVLREE
ncbi:MAG: aminotransferase class I/II-fold pyridoxal phosphate-dependent enzyme [Bacillota bacterium]